MQQRPGWHCPSAVVPPGRPLPGGLAQDTPHLRARQCFHHITETTKGVPFCTVSSSCSPLERFLVSGVVSSSCFKRSSSTFWNTVLLCSIYLWTAYSGEHKVNIIKSQDYTCTVHLVDCCDEILLLSHATGHPLVHLPLKL